MPGDFIPHPIAVFFRHRSRQRPQGQTPRFVGRFLDLVGRFQNLPGQLIASRRYSTKTDTRFFTATITRPSTSTFAVVTVKPCSWSSLMWNCGNPSGSMSGSYRERRSSFMSAPLAFNHRQRLNRPVGAQFVKHHSGGSVAQSDTFLVGNDQRPAGVPPDDSPHRAGKR